MFKHSHIVFALKNSRYELQKIHLKKPYGFVAPTFPFLEGYEEEILIEELCKSASAMSLEITALNFCGDHVHAIIRSESTSISANIGNWKGKTAYDFNRRINPSVILQAAVKSDGTKQSLWAKGYFQKYIDTDEQLSQTIHYIKNNRIKHGLPSLSERSLAFIDKLTAHVN